MRKSLFVLLLIISVGQMLWAQNKAGVTAEVNYSNSRSFAAKCDSVWVSAVPLLDKAGFALESMDRKTGSASFRWAKGQGQGYVSKDGKYETFRIDSAAFLTKPENAGCRAQILLTYSAYQKLPSPSWRAIESNNFLEQALLVQIAQDVRLKGSKVLQKAIPTEMPSATMQMPQDVRPKDSKVLQKATPTETPSAPVQMAQDVRLKDSKVLPKAVPSETPSALTVSCKAPALATIAVDSTPNGARIKIDGKFVGDTPSKFEFQPGDRQVEIHKIGYETWSQTIHLLSGADITLIADLVLQPMQQFNVTVPFLPPAAAIAMFIQEPSTRLFVPSQWEEKGSEFVATVQCPENVKEIPFSSGRPDRKSVGCGERIVVLREVGNWLRIRTWEGFEGHISPRFVK